MYCDVARNPSQSTVSWNRCTLYLQCCTGASRNHCAPRRTVGRRFRQSWARCCLQSFMLRALSLNTSAIILGHNHPSRSLNFSSADKRLTQRIFDAGYLLDISVLDHIYALLMSIAQGWAAFEFVYPFDLLRFFFTPRREHLIAHPILRTGAQLLPPSR